MCGIIGYSSHQKSSTTAQKIVQGLKKMEYRGYDSWGVAIAKPGKILIDKKTGAIGELGRNIKNSLPLGIGHTRWATHGGVTKNNAHPHLSVGGRFAVVQNGIVENFIELKKKLQKDGYKFKTQTDTEVIVHLVHKFLKKNDLREASRLAFLELKGRNTFVVLDHQTKTIIAVRQGSPLVVGRSKDEVLLASDTIPLLGNVPEIVYVDDNQLVEIWMVSIIYIVLNLVKK